MTVQFNICCAVVPQLYTILTVTTSALTDEHYASFQ